MGRGIRNSNWNYGGKNWKLSRSKIDLFSECPRCFYLDNKLGIRRPGMPAFLINSAVDGLLKKEFDIHRDDQSAHKLFDKFGIEAVPFNHSKIDTWRENFEGVQYDHPEYSFTISGAVDDLWQLADGTVAVIDYKSTAKDELDMSSKWVERYFRQLEVYQWLLRHNDVNVSDTAYILYANGDVDAERFDGKVVFKMSLHKHIGDTSWIDPILADIFKTLEDDQIPESGNDCEHCEYVAMQSRVAPKSSPTPENLSDSNNGSADSLKTLFD